MLCEKIYSSFSIIKIVKYLMKNYSRIFSQNWLMGEMNDFASGNSLAVASSSHTGSENDKKIRLALVLRALEQNACALDEASQSEVMALWRTVLRWDNAENYEPNYYCSVRASPSAL